VADATGPEAVTRPTANEIYERGLNHLLSSDDPASFHAVDENGARRRLPLDRWLTEAPSEEELLLERAAGPVLDIGCGAGRHLVALGNRGIASTGIEVSGLAVELARARGGTVIHGSVFDLTEKAAWQSALLLDGNIGISGEPGRLLRRTAELLRPGGNALVELDPPGSETKVLNLRLENSDDVSEWFPWAWVGVDGIESIAAEARLKVSEVWPIGQRWFAELLRN